MRCSSSSVLKQTFYYQNIKLHTMSKHLHPLLVLLLLAFTLLIACNKAKDPKQVSTTFVKDLYTLKFDEASSLATAATKPSLKKEQERMQQKGMADEEKQKRIESVVDAVFATNNLVVHTSGNEATVQNEILSIPLKKEEGEWKVAASEDLVQTVLYRQLYLENVKVAWQQLKEEYDKRTALVQDYINNRKGNGSATTELLQLEQSLKQLSLSPTQTAAQRASFVSKQSRFAQLLEKNIQPSFTASSDLSLNYIIQLGTIKDRIHEVLQAYNQAALKARSKEFLPVK